MKKLTHVTMLALAIAVMGSAALHAEEDNMVAFPVKIGGQSPKIDAVKKIGVIADAVAADAEIEVTVKDNAMVICNIVATDDKGDVKEGAAPAILLMQKTSKSALNQTMDKKALAAGNYRINVVADGKTTIINFKVK